VRLLLPLVASALLGLVAGIGLEYFKSREAFKAEIRRSQLTHIAEVWEKLYVLEACVEALIFVRNASTEVGKASEADNEVFKSIRARKGQALAAGRLVIDELNGLIQKDRFWLGEGLYYRLQLYVIELEKMLYTENVSNELLKKYRATQRERRQTLDGVRKALLRDSEPPDVEFDESLVTALRAQKDLTQGTDAK
jgi:hypothetical protein